MLQGSTESLFVRRNEAFGPARRFLTNLAPGNRELNDILVRRGVPPSMQTVDEIESIVAQATTSGGRPAWAADDWCAPGLCSSDLLCALLCHRNSNMAGEAGAGWAGPVRDACACERQLNKFCGTGRFLVDFWHAVEGKPASGSQANYASQG